MFQPFSRLHPMKERCHFAQQSPFGRFHFARECEHGQRSGAFRRNLPLWQGNCM